MIKEIFKYLTLFIISVSFIIFLIDKENIINYSNYKMNKEYKTFIQYKSFKSNSLNEISLLENNIYFNNIVISNIDKISIVINTNGINLNVESINNLFQDALPKIFKGIQNIYIDSYIFNNRVNINFDNRFKCSYDLINKNIKCNKYQKIISDMIKGMK